MLKQERFNLVGAAFEVYNELGFGMAEEIYQQSLEIELAARSIPFQTQTGLEVRYKTKKLKAVYRPDLFVYQKIVVELKAVKALATEHEGQIFNYMRISKSRVGYLINFGCHDKLEWSRFII